MGNALQATTYGKGTNCMIRYFFFFLFGTTLSLQGFSQLTKIEEELVAPSLSVSPDIDYLLEANLRAVSSSGENLPFWLHRNQRGRVNEESNFSTWLTGKAVLFITEDTFILTGSSILYNDGINEGVIPDELFAHLQNPWLYFTVGRKQRAEKYRGLSASNDNILWSLNARPLPGVQLGTSSPILLFDTWGPGFEASWSEYFLGKGRRIEKAKLHHKTLHFVYLDRNGLKIKAGVQHFAHWGGQLSNGTDLPRDSEKYWKAITFKDNLHTHMTSYEGYISYDFGQFTFEVLYNHLATDRSGRLYENAPDGRYGIYFQQKQVDHLVNAINYEFFYTKDQSEGSQSQFLDNYFNYYQYAEGWAYKDQFIGAPFFTYDVNSRRIIGNKFLAHHLGIRGQLNIPFQTNPYKLLLTYVRNSGTYPNPLDPSQNNFYTYFEMGLIKEPINIDLQFSSEATSSSAPVLGFGILLNYRL